MKAINSRCPTDRADRPAANLIDQPRRHSVSGNDPMTGAQAATLNPLEGCSEPDSF